MRIRYISADPAGNMTGMVLTAVEPQRRAALAAALMARCSEKFEQIAFVDETSLCGPLPRMDMMGGEFCGNATRAFALLAARRRGQGERTLRVLVSGAAAPVRVELEEERGCAYADMPLPLGVEEILREGRRVPVVRMEGIAHAVLADTAPSPDLARHVLAAMPREDAQGVLFVQGKKMTPLVYVAATGTSVWESSCGSGSVALAWQLSRGMADGVHSYAFEEPGGTLSVRVTMRGGKAVRAVMGGRVSLSVEREITL